MKNLSPWIHQLNKDRETTKLSSDLETDVAIIGGGIAGIATAFFLLRDTDKRVVLVEGGRIGHGATGHNAGQLTSYLARSFADLVQEFSPQMVAEAHRNIEEDAWELLDTMYTEAGLDIAFSRFLGHLGVSDKGHLISLLEDNRLREENGLRKKEIIVSDHLDFLPELKEKYDGLYSLSPHKTILERLEVREESFIACLSEQKGVMNSALLTEKLAEYLSKQYSDRFSLYEHTHIGKVVLHDDYALLDALNSTIKASRVVLCTNGFEGVTIINKSGLDIDTRFHYSLSGVVGYMSGYLEDMTKAPTAISYFYDGLSGDEESGKPYVYLTRRPYEYNENRHNLISVGGPDVSLEDRSAYEREQEYPDWAKDELDKFVRQVYELDPSKEIDYIFTWHGLMGYTRNKVRLVGTEPKNPVLLYNLGCNGVGLLPSIFGGDRIARIIKGEKFSPSIYDPRAS